MLTITPLIVSALHMLIYETLIFYYELCSVVRFAIVPSFHRLIVTSDSASQISISSDQRSIGDASDITTLQEECIAFGKYKRCLSCYQYHSC